MNKDIPTSIQRSIRKDEPIEMDGLTFYPVLVDELELLESVRPAVECLQQTFPEKYAAMPLLGAFYAYDRDMKEETGLASGWLFSATLFLCLCLRLGQGKSAEERLKCFRAVTEEGKLKALRFVYEGEEVYDITPAKFSRWRPILAEQNGLSVPDESANGELLEAQRDLEHAGDISIENDFDKLLASMALVCGESESEILTWSVRRFRQRQAAVGRLMNFITSGIGEKVGFIKWKGGNPHPSWCFDRVAGNPALIDPDTFMNGDAGAAIARSLNNVKGANT